MPDLSSVTQDLFKVSALETCGSQCGVEDVGTAFPVHRWGEKASVSVLPSGLLERCDFTFCAEWF